MWGAAGPRWALVWTDSWVGEEDWEGDGEDAQCRRKGCRYCNCFCCAGDDSFVWMEEPEA